MGLVPGSTHRAVLSELLPDDHGRGYAKNRVTVYGASYGTLEIVRASASDPPLSNVTTGSSRCRSPHVSGPISPGR